MKSLFSYLLMMFVAMFWVLRLVVALMATMGNEFIITPINETFEIVLLFLTLIPIALVFKRKVLGAVIYLLLYLGYFGTHIFTILPGIMGGTIPTTGYVDVFASGVGIILAILVIVDVLLDRTRLANPNTKKTEWFYQNEAYDREKDERADNNNYRTM